MCSFLYDDDTTRTNVCQAYFRTSVPKIFSENMFVFSSTCDIIFIEFKHKIGVIMAYGKITKKQQDILEYIKSCILNKGYPPSVRDICDAVNLKSTSSVHSHLETLEKNGYIRRDPAKPRAIEIIDDNFNLTRREVANIPLVGNVAAGQPILAIENYFPIPTEFLPNQDTFMLKVKGDSMINIGIFDGDYIIVAKQETASNGQVVVACVDDSATVKRFFKEDGHIRLQPENDSMDPIIVNDCTIMGKVIGLFRLGI